MLGLDFETEYVILSLVCLLCLLRTCSLDEHSSDN